MNTTPANSKDSGLSKKELASADTLADAPIKMQTEDLAFYYGEFKAIKEVSLTIPERCVTA
ncbi:MAG: hypothetical protein NXI22_22830, partial [bacterium]|nr:hypothetical protein [bacterium]